MPVTPAQSFRAALCLILLASVTGCAKYEYNLVKPPELARHIGTSTDAVFPVDPLEYRLITVDNRLVVRIFNPTQDNIELLGAKSSAVDPSGQSHPLRGQTIAAGSFVKLILPPPRPHYYDNSPNWNFGVGMGYQVRNCPPPHGHTAYSVPAWTSTAPRYLMIYDENDAFYWDWSGEGDCRLLLTFHRSDKDFTHEFLFRRQKM